MHKIEKEIIWTKISDSKYLEVTKSFVGKNRIGVFFTELGIKFNVIFDNDGYIPFLLEKFNITSAFNDVEELIYIDNGEEDFSKPQPRHFGYLFKRNEKNCGIILTTSFGVLKSTVSSFATYLAAGDGWVPVHGGVFKSLQGSVLLCGPSGAGKTTTIIKLADHFFRINKPFNILTDDWCMIKYEKNSLIAMTPDPSVSLKYSTVIENNNLYFSDKPEVIEQLRLKKKVSMFPDKLYCKGTYVPRISIDNIVMLLPESGIANLVSPGYDEFARYAVDAAYHYPYVSFEDHEMNHKNFWYNLARNGVVYKYYSRSATSNGMQSIKSIIDLIS